MSRRIRSRLTNESRFLREFVQQVLQTLLEAEMGSDLGASRYERSAERRGYRNLYEPRTLQTRMGTLDQVMPQDARSPLTTATHVDGQ